MVSWEDSAGDMVDPDFHPRFGVRVLGPQGHLIRIHLVQVPNTLISGRHSLMIQRELVGLLADDVRFNQGLGGSVFLRASIIRES